MPYTYILECTDGSYYVGSTWNLEERVSQNNAGEGSAYTRRRGRRPVKLVWAEYFDRIEDAFLLEKQIQGWGRAKRRALIERRYSDRPGLSRSSTPRKPGDASRQARRPGGRPPAG